MKAADLLKKFWEYNKHMRFGANVIALYAYLLNKMQELDECDFRLSDSEVAEQLRLARNTIKAARDILADRGIIKYRSVNGYPIEYWIFLDFQMMQSDRKIEHPKRTVKKVAITKLPEEATEIRVQHEDRDKWDKLRKEIGGMKKEKQPKEDRAVEEGVFPEIGQGTINPVNKEVVAKANVRVSTDGVPSFGEFMEHAKSLSIYDPEYDFSLEAKYEQWVADGWKNGMGKPIRNWKASLKSTFPYLKRLSKPTQPTGIPRINRPKTTYNE